jgi:serine/threonine protein kinase
VLKEIGKQIASALHHLHKNKIIHQDIKPSNVMFKSKEQVKLIDLGVSSKLEQTIVSEAAGAGTLRYMPPE